MNLNKLLIYSCISLLFLACEKVIKTKNTDTTSKTTTLLDNEYLIKGQSFNNNYKTIYLFNVSKDSLAPIDTSSVVNNTFKFRGKIENPAYFVVKTNVNKSSYKFLADASTIDLLLNDNLGYSSTYSSSDIQTNYKEYASKISEFKNKGVDLYYNLKGDFSKTNIDKLKEQRANLFKEQSDYIVAYISENPNSYLSVMLLEESLHYFPVAKLRSLYDALSANLKEQGIAKSINKSITDIEAVEKEKLKVGSVMTLSKPKIVGEYRPNAYAFSGLNPDGNRMSLKSIPQGKVVLLDFWASWCAPCRATNPTLVHLYNKYKDQGFVIMSVSEDKGEGEWISAIYTDNLSWDYHIIDKNKAIAFRYGVESIPYKILIDKYGRIASDKISGSKLEVRIQQLLAE